MKRFFKRLLKRIYIFSLRPFLKKGVNMKIGDAGSFRLDYIFAFSRFSTFGKAHNAGFKRWIQACRGKRSVFDIGAYIGLYSIPASSVIGRGGRIYAFEPSRPNRLYLERHIRFNNIDNVKTFPYLVGAECLDKAVFYENREVDGMDSVAIWKNYGSYEKVLKGQVSLDNFCRLNKAIPEIIKIDVEGAELNVLEGAGDTIRGSRPLIFLSAHPKRLRLINRSADELRDLIKDMDYAIYNMDGRRADDLGFNEYILIPAERGPGEIF